jgi:hypothetical protein
MKIIFTRWLLASVILITTMLGVAQTVPVYATDPTTSLTITKYASDRTTILSQITVSSTQMASGQALGTDNETHLLPVLGDGITHYYTQGPTFDPNNLWDPGETVNIKDKGATKGTDIKDLCSLVGGAEPGDTIQVCASDNYGNTEFPYANIYNPAARQGKMGICWYDNTTGSDDSAPGGYVPTWTNGMLLVFFAQTTNPDGKYVFGHQDMHDCLPENDWHWYWDGSIQYPSTNGGYIKWVNRINIFTDATTPWSVDLQGAIDYTMGQTWFENAISENCHGTSSYTDGQGNVWSGLPLWYTCGIVDDTTNLHGPGAFNDNLYYSVKVTGGSDNYSYTFSSADIARNNYIILADKLNGQAFSASYHPEYYPLKLVSSTFSNGGPSVAQITKIELLNISTTPPITPTPTPGTADWPLQLVGALSESMSATQFQSGVDCHDPVTYTEDNNTWSGMPLWMLVGQVDDTNKHGVDSFNDALAATNYQIKITAADGYSYTFYSTDVARNNNIILANKLNSQTLPLNITSGDPPNSHPAYPLKITGSGTSSGSRIGAVVRIELIGLPVIAAPAWDLNNDHVCNISDIARLGLHWGETGSPGFIPEDLNNDGVINVGDVVVLGRHWGETW